jgi:truncated hemoglobin YjbI
MQKPVTLYDKLGGYRCIEKMVADFYQTILNDESLNVFYLENVSDIADLHHLVTDFFSMVFGGPNNYKGRSMKESHKHMPITK